ncbi:Peptidase M20 domain-containing protein 2 [Pleurostoma richardsiae]|uniref:Peptidase M20 domain-containing protein 2 n=1 Tax=Pleurostoma richardsiae TaxID=41990 RepID=A0AA38RPF3_9PEZI|nr:Peptidase M20 domain-containing protein 2 [Pleurostoma richardsiae]
MIFLGYKANVVDVVIDSIDAASEDLRRLNLAIWNNPEIMFQEFKACKLLTEWLQNRGWSVKSEVYGIETAFEARFSVVPGGRTVCYNAEYDALPGLGHACGHNLIATSSMASAIGVSAALKALNTAGTVVVMGTPAEETGGGKLIMAEYGAWKSCDAIMMSHAMPSFSTPLCLTKASWKFRAKFRGKSAHAAVAPWDSYNACDAIVMAYNGLAMLRQKIQKTDSIQSVILEAGRVPNIIPDYSEGYFSLRSKNSQHLRELKERVIPVFDGAAAATGCTVELVWEALYEDVVSNYGLAERYQQHMINQLGLSVKDMLPLEDSIRHHDQNASSDFGNCTYLQPGIQAIFSIEANDMPHTPPFREASGTDLAHREALRVGKANALLGMDVILNDQFYSQIKEEWKEEMRKRGRL